MEAVVVEMLPGQWPRTHELVEITSYDPVVGAAITDYFATDDVQFVGDGDAPAATYFGLLMSRLSLSWRLFGDIGLAGASLPAAGEIEIALDDALVADGTLARWLRSAFDGRRVRWLRGPAGGAYADYDVVLDGALSGQRVITRTTMRLGLRDVQARLQRPLDGPVYAGTGGAEGGADLAGRRKPEMFGLCRCVTPQLVDAGLQVYDVSHSGLSSVAAVYDGMAQLASTPSDPPEPGQYFVDLANGRIKVGSEPTFGLTVTATGAAAAGATDAATLAAWILQHRLGLSSVEIDSDAFAVLATTWPATVGYYQPAGDETDGQALLDLLLCASAYAYYTTDALGRITCGRWSTTDATNAAACDIYIDVDDIAAGQLTLEPIISAPERVDIGCARCWTVVADPTRLAAGADAADIAFAAQDFRLAGAALTHNHMLATPVRIDTALDSAADAAALADVVAASEAGWLDVSFRLAGYHPSLQHAAQIWLEHADYAASGAARILGLRIDADGVNVEARLWL
jgi:hypothetical protein